MLKSIFLFYCLLTFIPSADASYPSTLWSSERIPETLLGVKLGHLTKGQGPNPSEIDLVTLSPRHLVIYGFNQGRLQKQAELKGGKRDEWFKLFLFDPDGDGVDEIIVSGFYGPRVASFVARFDGEKISIINRLDNYLSTITWNNEALLVAQKRLGEDDYTGPLLPMKGNENKLDKEGELVLPVGLSGESMSLYSIEGFNDGFLYLAPSGKVVYYRKEEGRRFKREWTSGEEYGGAVYYLDIPIKNPLNQVTDRRFYVPLPLKWGKNIFDRSMVELPVTPPLLPVTPQVSPEHVYLIKNTGYLKNVIGAVPSIKNSQIVRLVWTGYGFSEDWNSPRFDGAISDFELVDWDGDGSAEILATLLLRDKGYLDTLKNQDSLLIVIDVP